MSKSWPYFLLTIVVIGGMVGGYFLAMSIFQDKFAWGVTMRPNATAKYSSKSWDEQLEFVKDLGAKNIRLAWEYDAKPNPAKFMDSILEVNEQIGASTYLIVESKNPIMELADPYQSGFETAYDISKEFKGRIKYYQLANEGSAEVMIGHTANGQEESHYNTAQYAKYVSYLKGLSDGISKGDPKAKKVVTMVYTHTVYLDWLQRDNLDFDIIGIDWYDWMGKFEDKKLENGQLLFEKLKSYNKDLIFAEINALPGVDPVDKNLKTVVDEERQAKFISEEAAWAFKNRKYIKGFFVLELIDNVNTKYPEYFGLVKAVKNAKGAYEPGDVRKAFNSYKEIIKKYN